LRDSISLDIARIIIRFDRIGRFPSFDVGVDHERFLSSGGASPFTAIEAHYSPKEVLKVQKGECLFDAGGTWRLFNGRGSYVIELRMPPESETPYKTLRIRKDFMKGEMFCRRLNAPVHSPSTGVFEGSLPLPGDPALSAGGSPIETVFPPISGYPLDEVLMSSILSRGLGVEVHACGLEDNGRGFLFPGVSGAGKSTIAGLFKGEEGVLILSDDRMVVRRMEGRLLAFGTPWLGDAGVCDPGHLEVEKIFFIVHSDRNYARPITRMDAAARMLVRCFPTFWSAEGMSFTMSFIDEMVKEVPCFELGFVPDKGAVEFVRGVRA
jgi:hypothetical protein